MPKADREGVLAMAFHARSHPAPFGDGFTEVRVVRSAARFTVYAAREQHTERVVAIKTPTDAHAGWLSEQLAHEAAVLTQVGPHPHIVELYDQLTLTDGRPALVLQLSERALEDSLDSDHRLPVPDTAVLGIRLAGALETVHRSGWVHGNVRPQTVLLTESGRPFLVGFDESVPIGATESTWPLHITSPHTAPEVLEGGLPTPASDVYGLASTLYELVAGRAAFRGYIGESPAAIIVRVLSNPVRPITTPGVPLELSDLLTWSLSPDPARRPPSPAWLAEELRRLQSRQGWHDTKMIFA